MKAPAYFILLILIIISGCSKATSTNHTLVQANCVTVGGILGEAIRSNMSGRLSTFITDPSGPAIIMFTPKNHEQRSFRNWRGEHAGTLVG